MTSLEKKALKVLDIWETRLNSLSALMSNGDFDECRTLFSQVKAAHANFRIIDSRAEADGIALFDSEKVHVKATACALYSRKVEKMIRLQLDKEAVKLRKAKRMTKSISKFRSIQHDSTQSRLINPVQV